MQKWISLTFLYLIMLNWTLKIILCQPNQVAFKVKMLLLYCLYSYRKPWWAEVGRTYIHKRRNCTLWFWHSENFATSSVRQKQSNGNASWGVLYTALIGFGCISHSLPKKGFYILTHTWGFRRCSFRQIGRCQSLYTWNEWQNWLRAFFVCITIFINLL